MNWVERLIKKRHRLVVGLMSGTSMDGIDSAIVSIKRKVDGIEVKLEEFLCIPYPNSIKKELENINTKLPLHRLSNLNFSIGKAFADAALCVIKKGGFNPSEIDLIGSHGQTVFHNPPSHSPKTSSTLQIGEIDIIAEITGITTIGDFRTRDMAAGGEGAPLIAYVDKMLFGKNKKNIVAQNIGGIGNCTFLNPAKEKIIAFDTGPGNSLIDETIKIWSKGKMTYDKDGEIASSGKVDKQLLKTLMKNEYLKKQPPKTTGKEIFGKNMAKKLYSLVKKGNISLPDLISTLTQFTVESIYFSYTNFLSPVSQIEEVIVSGGGANNPEILKRLAQKLENIEVITSDRYGIPAEAKEAMGFAILANETIEGITCNIPSATGAAHHVPLGKISLGTNSIS